MLDYGTEVIFRCPHRCETWQRGYIAGRVGKNVAFEVVFPYDDGAYAYPSHVAYFFSPADYGLSYVEYEKRFDCIIGTCADINKL